MQVALSRPAMAGEESHTPPSRPVVVPGSARCVTVTHPVRTRACRRTLCRSLAVQGVHETLDRGGRSPTLEEMIYAVNHLAERRPNEEHSRTSFAEDTANQPA